MSNRDEQYGQDSGTTGVVTARPGPRPLIVMDSYDENSVYSKPPGQGGSYDESSVYAKPPGQGGSYDESSVYAATGGPNFRQQRGQGSRRIATLPAGAGLLVGGAGWGVYVSDGWLYDPSGARMSIPDLSTWLVAHSQVGTTQHDAPLVWMASILPISASNAWDDYQKGGDGTGTAVPTPGKFDGAITGAFTGADQQLEAGARVVINTPITVSYTAGTLFAITNWQYRLRVTNAMTGEQIGQASWTNLRSPTTKTDTINVTKPVTITVLNASGPILVTLDARESDSAPWVYLDAQNTYLSVIVHGDGGGGGTQYTHTLAIVISPAGAGIVNPSSGVYNAGQYLTLEATANPGYVFSTWNEGSNVLGTNPSLGIQMGRDLNITAKFALSGSEGGGDGSPKKSLTPYIVVGGLLVTAAGVAMVVKK